MAYDYDTDILAGLWTGAEDAEEPYASFIAANPDLTDDVAENRILSTIELLRSHMELLASRTEAALFRQVLSRTLRAAGSGGFVYNTDAPIQVIGNICNPVFPAGATFDITVDGSTTAVTSASGGDLDTVIAELNATLDASIPGVAEVTSTDTSGTTPTGLSGTHFLLNSAGDATEYYVWFDFTGAFEITSITVPGADVDGSLGGTRFDINSANDDDEYYVWIDHAAVAETFTIDWTGINGTLATGAVAADYFDVDSTTTAYRVWFSDGSTTPPAAAGRTLFATTTWTGGEASDTALAAVVAAELILADADFAGASNGGTAIVTTTLATTGAVPDAVDGTTGAAFAVTAQGVDAPADPAPAGRTAITATITVNDTASEVASAVSSAINANSDFSTEGTNPFTVTNDVVGATTDAEDQTTGFTISVTTQGADAAEDPAPVGKTSITVGPLTTESDSEIGSALRIAIGANADFSTEGVGTDVEISNAAVGATTDASDVDTGLTLTVDVQGSDVIGDAIGVTAFKTINNKLAFRSQVDFLAFEVADGGGGVLGPAGISAQTIESKRKIVADNHRDDSLGVFQGFRRPPDL